MSWSPRLVAVLGAAAGAAVAVGLDTGGAAPSWTCRCLPGDACWDALDWSELNRSVHGRLIK